MTHALHGDVCLLVRVAAEANDNQGELKKQRVEHYQTIVIFRALTATPITGDA
jgi:hypothetical protein